jgi:hypothetical protein
MEVAGITGRLIAAGWSPDAADIPVVGLTADEPLDAANNLVEAPCGAVNRRGGGRDDPDSSAPPVLLAQQRLGVMTGPPPFEVPPIFDAGW